MPFTAFHFGPGAAFKAIGGTRFSFMVFGGSQALMDIESGVRMIFGSPVIHGVSHSLAGAALIGCVAAAIGKPVSEYVLGLLRVPHSPISWTASISGAFIGTFSHVCLDAIMHSDMMPGFPFSTSNALLGMISVESLHTICVGLAGLGTMVVLLRYRYKHHT